MPPRHHPESSLHPCIIASASRVVSEAHKLPRTLRALVLPLLTRHHLVTAPLGVEVLAAGVHHWRLALEALLEMVKITRLHEIDSMAK